MFAQPLQERRSLRVTVARRVALRVSGHTYSLILITVIARYDPEGDRVVMRCCSPSIGVQRGRKKGNRGDERRMFLSKKETASKANKEIWDFEALLLFELRNIELCKFLSQTQAVEKEGLCL